jgi:hypothetical protein
MLKEVGRCLSSPLPLLLFFNGVFVHFSTRGFQKYRFLPSIFLIAFLAVSLHDELKNTIKIFFEIRPENLKTNHGR